MTMLEYMTGVQNGLINPNVPPAGSIPTNDPNIWDTPWGNTWQTPGYTVPIGESYDAWRHRVYDGSPAQAAEQLRYPATATTPAGYAGTETADRITSGGSPTIGPSDIPILVYQGSQPPPNLFPPGAIPILPNSTYHPPASSTNTTTSPASPNPGGTTNTSTNAPSVQTPGVISDTNKYLVWGAIALGLVLLFKK